MLNDLLLQEQEISFLLHLGDVGMQSTGSMTYWAILAKPEVNLYSLILVQSFKSRRCLVHDVIMIMMKNLLVLLYSIFLT